VYPILVTFDPLSVIIKGRGIKKGEGRGGEGGGQTIDLFGIASHICEVEKHLCYNRLQTYTI